MNHAPGARRIAACNNKGGVGKSFLIAALAEALARRGYRVLAVDMDPQGNLSRRLCAPRQVGRTLAEVLTTSVQNGDAGDIITRCGWDLGGAESNIGVLPSTMDLEEQELHAGMPGAVNRLRKALYGADEGFHFTLIDCQPSMGHLTQNVFAALDNPGDATTYPDTVLLPVVPEWDPISGARRAIEKIKLWREDLGVPHLRPSGVVVNLVREQTSLHAVRADQLGELFPDAPILVPQIPQRTRVADLQDRGEPLSADRDLVRSGLVGNVDALAERALSLPAGVPA